MNKKTIVIVAALIAVSFVSCKKNRTCSCTSTTVDDGTTYTTDGYSQQSALYSKTSPKNTNEIKYNNISKKYGNEVCQASEIDADNYDNTASSTTFWGTFLTGSKGTKTTTKTCALK
jgi:hypothetical protein